MRLFLMNVFWAVIFAGFFIGSGALMHWVDPRASMWAHAEVLALVVTGGAVALCLVVGLVKFLSWVWFKIYDM